MKIPYFENYGQYSSDNYGVHTLMFCDYMGNKYWYSYNILVAFKINGEFHIRKNEWGVTTGKHLNWICDDHSIREDYDTFNENMQRLEKQIKKKEGSEDECSD